jgi:uncharacterized protein
MVKINDSILQCKTLLNAHYGKKLRGVILYGSIARRKAEKASDIDLLVLLKKPFNYFKELRRIGDLLYPVQLESDRLISAKPVAIEDFKRGTVQLYRNAREEGIAV